jgi:hypothetical protein
MSSLLVFNRDYRLEPQSVMLVFRPSFVNYCPSNLLSCSPPPLPKVKIQCIQKVCGWEVGGGGVLSCFGDHFLQEINTLYLTRFRTYKIALPPQTKA